MKISVIVPVYNCEDYLCKCLDSLKEQTFSNLEIILIDDGSTDNSGRICDEYVKNDNRFRVVHRENRGVVASRNQGLEMARGDYVGFVDSDDYCKECMFEYLANIADEYDSDIACCGIERIYTKSGAKFYTRKHDGVSVYSEEKALEKFFLPDYITTAVWNKIFRTEIAQSVKFKEYARNDDGWFVGATIMASKRIAVGTDWLYVYQIRNKSITRGNFSSKNYDILRSIDDVYCNAIRLFPDNKSLIMAKIFWSVVFVDEMAVAKKNDKEVIDRIKKLIKDNLLTIIKYKELSFFRKFQFYLLAVDYKLYSSVYLLYCRLWGKE